MHVPAAAKGRVRLEKVQVGIPEGVYREIEAAVRGSGQWMSVVDFLREAAKEKLERWKKEHPLGLPPPQR